MNNTILLYNTALNLNLKQTMNDANDVLYNMQSLKQFQWNIDQVQKMKDGAQMQINMAALALLRIYLLDVGNVGAKLLHNLIRKYYPLNDEQIVKYETYLYKGIKKNVVNGRFEGLDSREWRYITNLHVIQRKGEDFSIGNILYRRIHKCYRTTPTCYTSYSKIEQDFKEWSWDLVQKMWEKRDAFDNILENLLRNDALFAQMGLNNVRETLAHLQEIVGASFEITEQMKNEVIARLEQKGVALYSYLPITKDFILQHQNELDWKILQKNPRIPWDWELINLYLCKVKETVSENEWDEYLLGSKAMYAAIENYLNDEILSDIEKLYIG